MKESRRALPRQENAAEKGREDMQVGTGKSVLNGIAIGKLKIYKKKDTTISTTPVTDTGAELLRFEDAQQKAIQQQTALYEKALAEWLHAQKIITMLLQGGDHR